ncbi:MAG: hypothetical protein Q8O84_05200 [Nanoarchaeota archaeon]|nr:hypothetical protein [Nanoarchaeota archaeon]
MFSNHNRGQTGETITWLVATVIIVVILIISVFVTQVFSNSSNSEIKENSVADVLASKSFFSYLLMKDSNGKIVFEQLKDEENLNEFNGNLGLKIFEEFYERDVFLEEYNAVWIGIVLDRKLLPALKNDYFNERPVSSTGGDINHKSVSLIIQEFSLTQNKSVQMILKGWSK